MRNVVPPNFSSRSAVAAVLAAGVLGCGGGSSAEDPLASDSNGLLIPETSGASNADGASAGSPGGGAVPATEGGGAGTTGDSTADSSSGLDCASVEVEFTAIIPTVLLLIDQSGSMRNHLNGERRWYTVRNALIDPVDGVIANLEDDVRFGLALYTSLNGYENGGQCPMLVEVETALGNYDDIAEVYSGQSWMPEGDTPTGESIDAAAAVLLAEDADGPKFIVLATDGAPDTCTVPDPNSGSPEAAEAAATSVAAAENAFAAGVETYIVSVGSGVAIEHLQDMANAGSGWSPGDPDAAYYVPADQAEMVEVFESIIEETRTCAYTLDQAIKPGHGDSGMVTINGVEIPFNDPDGWQINSPTEIELLGAACEAVQDGDVEIAAEFTCYAIQPR